MSAEFDWGIVSPADLEIARRYGATERKADLIIAPDGNPYLYRWWIIRSLDACVYFHVQVADDPERPLHDHPWANMSVILAGGYDETFQTRPADGSPIRHRALRTGDVAFRTEHEAHRLELPSGYAYTMTQFTTGKEVKRWGFWYPEGWVDSRELTITDAESRRSIHNRKLAR